MTDNEPTLEELKEYWHAHTQQKEAPKVDAANSGQPVDSQGNELSYASMRDLWNQKRGLNPNENTPEPLTPEQKELDAKYRKLRAEWFARQGKTDNLIKKQQWENRLKEYQAKYSR